MSAATRQGEIIEFICLADSLKLNGHCIAGLRLDGQGWIRPVSDAKTGELLDKHIRFAGGGMPKVGDVVRAEFLSARPEACQPENCVVDVSAPWNYLGTVDQASLELVLDRLSSGDLLFGDADKRIAVDVLDACAAQASLALVEPRELVFRVVQKTTRKGLQARAAFRLGRIQYDLPFTDLAYVEALYDLGEGEYSVHELGIAEGDRLLLTVSLAEPFEDFCYKLVAGLVSISELERAAAEDVETLAAGEDEGAESTGHRGREIPWLPVVRFHKEIVARAEQGFFSLNGRDDQADRWSSLSHFDPVDLAGPWAIEDDDIKSRPFRLTLEQGQHESVFLGGPCFLGWTKSLQGKWMPQWRPLLYREVAVTETSGGYKILPQEGAWSLSPLLFSMLDRSEACLAESPDELPGSLMETAASYREVGNDPLDQRILRALFSKAPAIEDEIGRQPEADTFRVRPTPWVLFAPTGSFSALTRHLMQDYERLEGLLSEDETNIGGLCLLEDKQAPEKTGECDVLPVVPLNASQRQAVQRILEHRPLTVISGPPGTGKSQVVVALLLNAWAQGKTVLFASNNNKAVDVVRERVERFESEFPIVVRAGNKQVQNIQEVLRRTLNMAGMAKTGAGPDGDGAARLRHRQRLVDERSTLLDALDSELPQRVDESRATALRGYGEYRATLAKLTEEQEALVAERGELGFPKKASDSIVKAVGETRVWLEKTTHYRSLVKADDERRAELEAQIADSERRRDRAVEEVGLSKDEGGDWRWLVTGPSAESVMDWEQRFRTLLGTPLEQALEEVEWHDDYSRWRSADAADTWALEAREFAETILRVCAELAPKLAEISRLSGLVEDGRRSLAAASLPEDVDLSLEALREWTANYAELATAEPRALDALPWSQRAKLRRRLQRLERQLRSGIPLEVLTKIGPLNDDGRSQLAPVIEAARRWIDLQHECEEAQRLVEETEERFGELRSHAAALKLHSVPVEPDTQAWLPVSSQCEETALVADRAASAWRRRVEKETAEKSLRKIAKEWGSLASGVPLREAWRRGQGSEFDLAVQALADQPGVETLVAARGALYAGRLPQLLESWREARGDEQRADELRGELRRVPGLPDRVEAWWADRPDSAFVMEAGPRDTWPELEGATAAVDRVADWCLRWQKFDGEERPAGLSKAESELEWAVSKLEQAVEVLPAVAEQAMAAELLEQVHGNPSDEWPIAEFNEVFSAFSPERIRGDIARLEAELEQGSFDDAKARWLERLKKDDAAVRAVDGLEKSIRQYKGEVVEAKYGEFRAALRAVPIWVTTAQASQAIPLEPELFDMVVIDEASQCTLTNLLPLMFRGKTLAVIGDDNQLPAIPTIQESEELALARKFEIEEYLSLVGHATNDVYNTAAESLPRRRADVIMLDEHFRSHPQIIGFANRHIYQQRLELKKDPSWGSRLPIGSGVHTRPVPGVAKRGDNGRSWLNAPEAEVVLDLVQSIRRGDGRSVTIGVVTPFRAQKDYMRDRLDKMGLAADVLVDTAYGFQGDERDVIVFSPVVAKGITSSASRWVEMPPNLINVAITRAREALFVVGDFDYCLQQEGILRKLALYCRDVQMLRDTSPAELELFSWMMVKGWEAQVHPRVGDIEVDFVLKSTVGARLAIEVDGGEHRKATEKDKARDAYLLGQGFSVLRVAAREVMETPFDVIHQIEDRLQK
jgi:very-short-patch-repair endonuclease